VTARDDVVIRPVELADLPALYEHQADPEAVRMADFPARERDAFMVHWRRILADGAGVTLAIVAGGRVAGSAVSWRDGDRQMVGYWIGRDHWGQGLASRGLAALLAELDERPLYAHVATHNAASIRVLEKAGFTRTDEAIEAGFVYALQRRR